jgi:putative spermidine/putrescine transport system substrate-binding protein
MKPSMRLLLLTPLLTVALLLGACATPSSNAPVADSGTESQSIPVYASWEEVLTDAQGSTVNWFLWGGSETINTHVDEAIGGALAEQFDITLNRVPLENTADAVNKVLNEKAAGRDSGGSIDLIWINGDNFRTLKDAGLLYGPFVDLLPNSTMVDWDNPAIAFDFGVAVDGYESPWASFQWVLEYNSATVGDNPPTTFEALQTWIEANPSRFTYPALPNHVGAAFVRQIFYWVAGGPEPFLGDFDQAIFDEHAPEVWAYLNAIEPNLWRQGQTYPELAAMTDLLANQEIDFNMEYDSSRAATYIREGLYPDTIRTTVFDTGTLANVSYVAIPYNAANPAGALVLANHLLSPAYQTNMTQPDVLGWRMAIEPDRIGEAEQAALTRAEQGAATLPPEILSRAALPEMSADWVDAIEQGWEENVLRQ